MSGDLSGENQRLRRQLAELMSQARENERILHRYQAQELALIGAVSFKELVQNVLYRHKKTTDLDSVSLAIVDPEYELRRTLPQLGIEVSEFPGLLFFDDDAELTPFLGPAFAPTLGKHVPSLHTPLFPATVRVPRSLAILPLVRQKKLIGTLNFASEAPERFVFGLATDFMQRLAAIVAVCLENVINYERLKHIGLIDPLTGAHNRRYLEQRLHEEAYRSKRQGTPLSCLFMDVDHFKRINDTYGHHVGDRVLQEVALRIKAQLRLSDTLGRYGGEEFAALLAQTDRITALAIAERIRESIVERTFTQGDECCLAVSLSIGVATIASEHQIENIETVSQQLMACADQALYRAKRSGRNCVM